MTKSRNVQLEAMFPACQRGWTASTAAWSSISINGAWNFESKVVAGVARPYAWIETSIDLSKMQMDEETLFPVGVTVQDPGMYVSSEEPGKAMVVLDLITTKEIDPSSLVEYSGLFLNDLTGTMYGMMGSTDDQTQIVFGQYRLMTGNANIPALPDVVRTEWANDFSSGEPTAADKLHCYRIVQINGVTDTQMYVPAARFYLAGAIGEEPDIEYMMRLKRSYELQQS
jgi:hypothetical protein